MPLRSTDQPCATAHGSDWRILRGPADRACEVWRLRAQKKPRRSGHSGKLEIVEPRRGAYTDPIADPEQTLRLPYPRTRTVTVDDADPSQVCVWPMELLRTFPANFTRQFLGEGRESQAFRPSESVKAYLPFALVSVLRQARTPTSTSFTGK